MATTTVVDSADMASRTAPVIPDTIEVIIMDAIKPMTRNIVTKNDAIIKKPPPSSKPITSNGPSRNKKNAEKKNHSTIKVTIANPKPSISKNPAIIQNPITSTPITTIETENATNAIIDANITKPDMRNKDIMIIARHNMPKRPMSKILIPIALRKSVVTMYQKPFQMNADQSQNM